MDEPYKGYWRLPGSILKKDESLENNIVLGRGGCYQYSPGLFSFDWAPEGDMETDNVSIRLTISMK